MFSEDDARPRAPVDVGARLRAAREARQISLREIAATTKISVGALEALEENDFAQLPGGIFTRAFVRSYAGEVGLDPEETMRDFVAQEPVDGVDEDRKLNRPSQEHDLFQSQQQMAGTVLKLVLLGVPVVGLLVYFGTRAVTNETEAPQTPPAEAAPVALAPAELPVRAAPSRPPAPDPLGELTLVLRPRDDCWISLRVDGEPMFERTMRAGEEATFEADEEISLIVGDAGAFAFTINQQDGRSLGASGDIVTLNITRQNYRSYLEPRRTPRALGACPLRC